MDTKRVEGRKTGIRKGVVVGLSDGYLGDYFIGSDKQENRQRQQLIEISGRLGRALNALDWRGSGHERGNDFPRGGGFLDSGRIE